GLQTFLISTWALKGKGVSAVQENEFPFLAIISHSIRPWSCIGTIITRRRVLTAAGCVYAAELGKIHVFAGYTRYRTDSDLGRYDVSSSDIVVSPKRECDIGRCYRAAILTLTKTIDTERVRPSSIISGATLGMSNWIIPFVSVPGIRLDCGRHIIKQARMTILPLEECKGSLDLKLSNLVDAGSIFCLNDSPRLGKSPGTDPIPDPDIQILGSMNFQGGFHLGNSSNSRNSRNPTKEYLRIRRAVAIKLRLCFVKPAMK
ncbi:hypothetical protein QAD02_009380, partial [Eretmocerus hayati]